VTILASCAHSIVVARWYTFGFIHYTT
jgi:hypothetical protein